MKFLKEDNAETKRLNLELLNKKDEEIKLLNTKIQHSGMIYKIYDTDKTNLLYIGKSDKFSNVRIQQHFESRLKITQYPKIDRKLSLIDVDKIIIEKQEFNYFTEEELRNEENRQIALFNPKYNMEGNYLSKYPTKCGKTLVRRLCYEKHIITCKKCLNIA